MKMRRMMFSICIAAMAMYACGSDDIETEEETGQPDTETEIPDDTGDTTDDDLKPNSQDVSYDNAVKIVFSSSGATVTNPFENNGVTAAITNGHVVVTSTITDKVVNYVMSGITTNGSLKIYGQYAIGLVFNGVGITNSTGAAINIQSNKDVSVTIVDNTNNRLIDGSSYTLTDGEDMKAAFFSEGSVVVGGNGNLEIRGKYKHGFCTDGALTISSGTLNIKEAATDGIHANDQILISGGDITIRSVGDGIESESKTQPLYISGGDITVVTTGEKGHALKSKYDMEISTSGVIDITTYGAASKGIKPSGGITIYDGDITVRCSGDAIWDTDDLDISSSTAIKCDGNFLMEDGSLTLLATGKGGKGISADGTLTVNGGTISATTTGAQYIYDSSNDTAAKAIKSDGNLTINGGYIKIRTSKTEAEGLESKATLKITGGELDIEAYDDAINATSHIQIDGGNVYCYSTTNDAIDSNGTLTITGGVVIACGASQPEAGFDCDNNRFTITGGTLVGLGGATSTPTASSCTQRSLVFNTSSTGIQYLNIQSTSAAKEVLTIKLPRTYTQGMTMLFSSSLLQQSTGYTIYTGGSISGGTEFHGLYTGATYTKGTQAGTFTTGSAAGAVSTVGSSQGPR